MIKTVLTDQTVVSGIGNEYADEILYQARIHPRERTDRISEKKMDFLFDQMNKVLKTAVEKDADVSKCLNIFFCHLVIKEISVRVAAVSWK